MKNYSTSEKIYDLWHFIMYLKELDSNKMSLKGIRNWFTKTYIGVNPTREHISEAILDTWNKCHSYQRQLREANDKLHRRNMQIKELKEKNKEIRKLYDEVIGGYNRMNPKDYRNLLSNPNIRNAGQFWTSSPTKNGKVGMIVGLNVLVSNTVTADEALVVVGKEAATWQTASPLKVETITDPGVKWTIRAWEVGVTQVTNPDAICKISNTAA